ncbi:non-canonical purine NTP pyrophosphatase [Anaerocolumna cellulosilytica]|uniref:dITP/XTP pyrophosphatase n=2 Tax=Anaerocolumna cellulosilytica TaxID=433286 RepID=A0A6S6R3C0_9FIRM|nr:non-canonical purine NTP pyrophosphatase [Anaerocolumna cellulosilytica]
MREVRMILKDMECEVLSLKEAGIEVDIVEDGNTFEENALIKAKTIMELTGEIVLADDSGLEVDAMDKAPGIYSARFMGEDTSYEIKNNYIIERLRGLPQEERTGRFVCVITAAFPNSEVHATRGVVEGFIAHKIEGENGFGYDPIFWVPEYKCTLAELSSDNKNKISHRGRALEAMKEILRTKL